MPVAKRKSPRIPGFDYAGPLIGHLVMVTRLRRPAFQDPRLAEIGIAALHEAAAKFEATVHAYCFMPDHAHILVEVGEAATLAAFAKHFKQLSGFRLRASTGSPPWQISYYDHLLRKPEAVLDVSRYIWENPVRAALVENRIDYKFSGPRDYMGA